MNACKFEILEIEVQNGPNGMCDFLDFRPDDDASFDVFISVQVLINGAGDSAYLRVCSSDIIIEQIKSHANMNSKIWLRSALIFNYYDPKDIRSAIEEYVYSINSKFEEDYVFEIAKYFDLNWYYFDMERNNRPVTR